MCCHWYEIESHLHIGKGAHYPERATSIQYLWNGVFTSRFILDQPFPGISLRYLRSDLFFRILLKVSLTMQRREKNLQSVNSMERICIKGMPLLHVPMWKVQIKRMELWKDQFKEWWTGMMKNDKWKTEYSSKNNGVSPPSFLLRLILAGKAYLEITLLVKTPLPENRGVARSW